VAAGLGAPSTASKASAQGSPSHEHSQARGFVVFAREADAMRVGGQSRDDLQMHLRSTLPEAATP
jgi:hypothetical protein